MSRNQNDLVDGINEIKKLRKDFYKNVNVTGKIEEYNEQLAKDLVIQKDENHLLVGTHGRSIYLADISLIQDFDIDKFTSNIQILKMKDVKYSNRWGTKRSTDKNYIN